MGLCIFFVLMFRSYGAWFLIFCFFLLTCRPYRAIEYCIFFLLFFCTAGAAIYKTQRVDRLIEHIIKHIQIAPEERHEISFCCFATMFIDFSGLMDIFNAKIF